AQRLSASLWSALEEAVGRAARGGERAQRLSASLWSARQLRACGSPSPISAQRLSASLWSAPPSSGRPPGTRSRAQRLSASLWSAHRVDDPECVALGRVLNASRR